MILTNVTMHGCILLTTNPETANKIRKILRLREWQLTAMKDDRHFIDRRGKNKLVLLDEGQHAAGIKDLCNYKRIPFVLLPKGWREDPEFLEWLSKRVGIDFSTPRKPVETETRTPTQAREKMYPRRNFIQGNTQGFRRRRRWRRPDRQAA